MNHISLTGIIASTPETLPIGNGQAYTTFQLRVHGSYLNKDGDPYSFHDEHPVICVGAIDWFLRTAPPSGEIEIEGELRSRIQVKHVPGPLEIEIAYLRSEIVANSIRFGNYSIKRVADDTDDALIALYRPEEA